MTLEWEKEWEEDCDVDDPICEEEEWDLVLWCEENPDDPECNEEELEENICDEDPNDPACLEDWDDPE